MPRCRYGFNVLHSITFATMNRLSAVLLAGCFLLNRIFAFPAMTIRIDISGFNRLTHRAGSILTALVGAVRRGHGLPVAKAVPCCCDFLIGGVIAVFASVVSIPAYLRAGCPLCFVMHEVMTSGRNYLCFYSSAFRAGICSLPRCCAGWRSSYYPAIPNMFSNIVLCCADITHMPMIVFV